MTSTKEYKEKLDEIKKMLESQKVQSATNLLHQLHLDKPKDSKVLTLLGLAAYKQNDYEDAKNYWINALEMNPKNSECHLHLANLYLELEQYDNAIVEYQKITKGELDNAAALNMALAFERNQRYWQAAQILESIINTTTDIKAFYHYGFVLKQCGKLDQSVTILKRALELAPKDVDCLIELAEIYYKINNPQEAIDCLKKVLLFHPKHARALFWLTKLPSESGHIHEIKLIQNSLNDNNLSEQDSALLHYSLGRIYDERNFYERAYYHYFQANQFSAQFDRLDEQTYINQINIIKKHFDKHIIENQKLMVKFDKQPIFIIGMSASGKSLVEKLLIQHPLVTTLGRQSIFEHVLTSRISVESDLHDIESKLSQEVLLEVAEAYINQLSNFGNNQSIYFCDIAPANFMYLGLISLLFSDARIIYCNRDPIDLCLRNFFHYYDENHGYAHDLASMAKFYNANTQMVSFWRSIGVHLLEVPYENLLKSPQATMNKVFKFLEIPPLQNLNVPKLSLNEIGRWRKYMPYVQVVVDLVYNK